MDKRAERTALIFLAAGCAAAFLVPLFTSFSFGSYFSCNLLNPAFQSEWKEIAVLGLLSGAVVFGLKDSKWKAAALFGIASVFCYYHINFLPFAAGGIYLLILLLTGSFVRGVGIVIVTECILSLFSLGCPENLRIAVLGMTVVTLIVRIREKSLKLSGELCHHRFTPLENTVLFVVFLVFLVQAGRMNGTLDFDSLWYGLRSEYVLAPGGGIYEDTGLLGLVYTYSKGAEVLTLPLSGFRSHSYILFFYTWVFLYGLFCVYRLTLLFTENKGALMAVILTALVPGIVNMCVSAKPDMLTWVLQTEMLASFFSYVKEKNPKDACRSVSAFLLSLCMKPTAIVFSTALFGMMVLYVLIFQRKKRSTERLPQGELLTVLLSGLALCGIWGRTLYLTGLPFTSVFSGVLEKLGFRVKYPFPVSALPENFQDRPAILVLADRVWHMLLSPVGEDMSHVIIAWGGSFFFAAVCVILFTGIFHLRKKTEGRKKHPLTAAALWVFLPFLLVNLIALSMLYQVDGNYFMCLYSVLILLFCAAFEDTPWRNLGNLRWALLVPLLCLQFLVMTASNWASVFGFTEFTLNRGSYYHRAYEKEYFMSKGAGEIWDLLEENPEARVIAFADHPDCLSLPCVVQSFDDTFDSWGNKDIVYSSSTYAEYLRFAKVDYLFLDPSYFDTTWHRRARLIFEGLTEKGLLTEVAGSYSKLYRVGE